MRIMRWFALPVILLLFASTSFSAEVLEKLRSLEEVDYIRVSGYIKDGDLLVTIIYKNMESGRLVYWEEGKVSVECEIYENAGDTIERKKGRRLAIVNKNLTHNEQDIRINIPSVGKDKRGIIYCTVNTGYKEISARGDFWFK
ncbi:MAG: hypothetical protein ABH843_07210 [Candidatus Omnitrophota bacterium]